MGVFYGDGIQILLGDKIIFDALHGDGWVKEVAGRKPWQLLNTLDGSEGFTVVVTGTPKSRHLRCTTCHKVWNGEELMYRSNRNKWHCLKCQPARQDGPRHREAKRFLNPNQHERTMTGWKQ